MRRLSFFAPALSGVALWLSFPPTSAFPLAWVGMIPYLIFITKRRSKSSLLVGHLTFCFLYFGGVLYWIPQVLIVYGHLHVLVAGLVFGLMLALMSAFLLPFTLLTQCAAGRGRKLGLLCAPGFWLFTEIARNYWMVNGFPWASLGYSQFPYLWIVQIADLGGVYFLSFLIVLVNCGLLALFHMRDLRFALSILFIFGLTNLYGVYRLYLWEPVGSYRIKAGLVQGNISLAEDKEYYAKSYFEVLPRLARQASKEGAQWVLLPEAQNPYIFEQDFYFKTFWKKQASVLGVFILFNSAALDKTKEGVYYNSAYQLDPTGEVSYRYDKVHLVPFGEYLPFAEWLSFAKPLVAEVSSFHPGSDLRLARIGEVSYGTLICYEAIFPEISRSHVEGGAEILVNLTNDAWFGATAAPSQHLQMAVFRAIENRRPFLRAANSGHSAIVSLKGRVEQKTPLFVEDVIVSDVEANGVKSPFALIGNGLNGMLIMVTFVVLFVRLRQREKRSVG